MMRQLRGTPLKRFLRDWRRAYHPSVELALVLQSIAYPVNVGSLFRIADGAGVTKMFLCGITPLPSTQTISKVARRKEHDVQWFYEERTEDAIEALRRDGYGICGLEIATGARPYFEAAYPAKLCLVLGNEDHGLTKGVLSMCDFAVFVPMYGKGLSLNVHVCAAVVLYHALHHAGSEHESR